MSDKTNLSGNPDPTEKLHSRHQSGSESMETENADREKPRDNFVEPMAPVAKSASLNNLSKKLGENKKKGQRGRPASKKRTASDNSDFESDGEGETIIKILKEMELFNEMLEKRVLFLEEKAMQSEKENETLKKRLAKLEQDNKALIESKKKETRVRKFKFKF